MVSSAPGSPPPINQMQNHAGCRLTKPPEAGNHVDKGYGPVTQAAPELVAQSQEVVGDVHAVVVVDGSQLWELLKVLSSQEEKEA